MEARFATRLFETIPPRSRLTHSPALRPRIGRNAAVVWQCDLQSSGRLRAQPTV